MGEEAPLVLDRKEVGRIPVAAILPRDWGARVLVRPVMPRPALRSVVQLVDHRHAQEVRDSAARLADPLPVGKAHEIHARLPPRYR